MDQPFSFPRPVFMADIRPKTKAAPAAPALSAEWTAQNIAVTVGANLLTMAATALSTPADGAPDGPYPNGDYPPVLTQSFPGKWMSSLPTTEQERAAFVRMLSAACVTCGDETEITVTLPNTEEGREHRWICADLLDAITWCLLDTPWAIPVTGLITGWGGTSIMHLTW